MISKEQLEARKAQLTKQAEELRANLQAVSGAIQLCDLLLAEDRGQETGDRGQKET